LGDEVAAWLGEDFCLKKTKQSGQCEEAADSLLSAPGNVEIGAAVHAKCNVAEVEGSVKGGAPDNPARPAWSLKFLFWKFQAGQKISAGIRFLNETGSITRKVVLYLFGVSCAMRIPKAIRHLVQLALFCFAGRHAFYSCVMPSNAVAHHCYRFDCPLGFFRSFDSIVLRWQNWFMAEKAVAG
jgi:hypothetical protein